ncbi:phosphatase PAP2 family protein [Alkalihalobacterium bogoriense]|uniref:phosphatase PAP2 family protein n=1 Tax=Alkalihalobacterium bogoriense TaxID=246272 RepID=UPI00047C704E|nr:phosphatase PAP2 family protein [Alkalihalobacterium bogoriense]
MNQIDILIWFTKWQHPFLDFIASILTFFGNEEFYFLILPLIYWCVSKQMGFRLFYIFLLSMYSNAFLKVNIAVTRPIGSEGISSIFVESAQVGSHYPHDSFPSGHAQGSTTLWGYLAYMVKQRNFTIFACILIFLVSCSRLYSGLHWPIDVISGVLIGLGIILLSFQLQQWMSATTSTMKWGIVTLVPLVLMFVFPHDEGIKYSAFLLGAGIGYLLEKSFVNMEISPVLWRKIVVYAIGIIGIFVLQGGLKVLFPPLLMWDFIRYVIIGLWGLLGAPYLFILFGLYKNSTKETGNPQ